MQPQYLGYLPAGHHRGIQGRTQLENGTATTNDYLIAVNAEAQARQNLILHEIQLIMYQYNAKTTTGN